nr:HTTM domain-containing protein [Actinacidiphila yeochonensis]
MDRAVSRGLAAVTGGALGRYQSAVVRIGMASTWLLFLLREFPHRDQLYGPGSAWGPDLAKSLIAGNHAFTVLLWNDGRGWFELCYALAVAASATLLLGWRTRTSALMFMIGVLSLQNRSVFMGDGGDNVVHIMAIYLAFTRCGQVWSLDSRRARRRAEASAAAADPADLAAPADPAHASGAAVAEPADPVGIALWVVLGGALVAATLAGRLSTGWGLVFWGCLAGQLLWWAVRRYAPGEPRTVMDIMGNVVHNGAMLVLAAEVCLVYSTAGWYKIQGSRWQDGTALYYPLHLDDFTPWPALSHALAGNGVLVMIISYGTVIVQVAFPFTLFNRRVKNVLLVGMMLEHASIAVVLGLPFFSLAMIAADAVFLPTGFLLWLGWRLTSRPGRGAEARARSPGCRGRARPATGQPGPSLGLGRSSTPFPARPGTPPSTRRTARRRPARHPPDLRASAASAEVSGHGARSAPAPRPLRTLLRAGAVPRRRAP